MSSESMDGYVIMKNDFDKLIKSFYIPLWEDYHDIHVTDVVWCLNKALLSRIYGYVANYALALLRGLAFHKLFENKPQSDKKEHTEFKMRLPYKKTSYFLCGTIDYLKEYKKDHWYLVDYKSSTFLPKSSQRKYSMQVNVYHNMLKFISEDLFNKIDKLGLNIIDSAPYDRSSRNELTYHTIPIETCKTSYKEFNERLDYLIKKLDCFFENGELEQISDPFVESWECRNCPYGDRCSKKIIPVKRGIKNE